MKELGILGGMGPLATAEFLKRIIENTDAAKDQDHINTIAMSNTEIPDRTKIILEKLDHSLLLDVVKEDLKVFESLGVKRISAPCNTFHFFYDDVQAMTDIKIINMIEETIKYVHDSGAKNIAVLATKGTINSGVFEKYALKYDMNILKLEESTKDFLMDTIYGIKSNSETKCPEFLNLIEELKGLGAERVIVACTELSLIDGIDLYSNIMVDSLDVLVKESILQLGYKLKSN